MNEVTKAYIACALWLSEPDSPDPDIWGIENLPPEVVDKATKVCYRFSTENFDDITEAKLTPDKVGHDLWLTRNGHGTGFWDRSLGDVGDRLTSAAEKLGESYLYVGDDGKLYFA